MLHETSSLLNTPEDDVSWVIVQVPSTGLRHLTGISSRYSTTYPSRLQDVISKAEFTDIMDRLNDTIIDYWPCNPCYYFGYACCLCTLGLSVLIPNYCASYSELYATAFLKNVSLKAKYFDKKISFTLIKRLCNSYVEIRYPAALLNQQLSTDSTSMILMSDIENNHEVNSLSPLVGRSDPHGYGGNVVITMPGSSSKQHERRKKS